MQHTHPKQVSASHVQPAKDYCPARRARRQFKPRTLDTYSNHLYGGPEDETIKEPSITVRKPSPADDDLGNLLAEVNVNYLGLVRVTKAGVEFGRTAGRTLHQIQRSIGENAFHTVVERKLPLSQQDANALIRFSQAPEVCRVDVSPATEMSLTRASQLESRLHAYDGATT